MAEAFGYFLSCSSAFGNVSPLIFLRTLSFNGWQSMMDVTKRSVMQGGLSTWEGIALLNAFGAFESIGLCAWYSWYPIGLNYQVVMWGAVSAIAKTLYAPLCQITQLSFI